jgi:hypothetical protein
MKSQGQAFISLGLLAASWVMMRIALLTQTFEPLALARPDAQSGEFENMPSGDFPPSADVPTHVQMSQAPNSTNRIEATHRESDAETATIANLTKRLTDVRREMSLNSAAQTLDVEQPRDEALAILPRPIDPVVTFAQGDLPVQKLRSTAPRRIALSGSLWMLARPTSDRENLLRYGQIGGAQIGGRTLVGLGRAGSLGELAASIRASSPLKGSGQELALGLSLKAKVPIPLEIIAERRFSADQGASSKWALVAATGVDALPLTKSIRLDAYGQAGIVAGRSTELFAGASVELSTAVQESDKNSVHLGVGLWGDVQRGAARIDAGPELTVRLRLSDHPVRVSAQWRARLVGNAEPGSGPALVVASDF